ncbi:MAG: polysaccharide deacetylase family protein [Bacteroidales bacterium]|nr:polysaccharide deacetylase family protein [Bacteroidales bacterium]
MRFITQILSLVVYIQCFGQNSNFDNNHIIQQLYKDEGYISLKSKVANDFANAKPGKWGEFVKGVDEELVVEDKIIAITFDACGGKYGSNYDKELIEYLRKEKIPATLFVSGLWIDENFKIFQSLSKDTLFEIENHGFNHKPCSVDGESEYGIKGTINVTDAFDEIEANARKIEMITGRRPKFFRSATAFIDEACAKIAKELGITVISFDILSGDAIPNAPINIIEKNVLSHIRPGAIIIMHFNHPKWNTYESLLQIIPKLRSMGYTFAKIENFPLKRKN